MIVSKYVPKPFDSFHLHIWSLIPCRLRAAGRSDWPPTHPGGGEDGARRPGLGHKRACGLLLTPSPGSHTPGEASGHAEGMLEQPCGEAQVVGD